jgi:DNA repair/transcription protein MET18/MMS19
VLGQHKDELLGCFTSGIKTSSFKRPALEGYMQLVQLEGFLEEEEVGFVVQTLNELILAEDASELR